MKAIAIFPKTHQIKMIDHPEPQLTTPTQVKIKIHEIGVCGTDKELCHFEYGLPPKGSEYLIIGHESLGEVIEVGVAVSHLKVGDWVYTMVRRPCEDPLCYPCQHGRQDFCETGQFKERGIKEAHGFMAEYIVEDVKYLAKVPHTLSKVAILVDPLCIAEKALDEYQIIQKRIPTDTKAPRTALVLGAGAIGILGAMKLVQEKFNTQVYSQEPSDDPKAVLIRSFGAEYISAQDYQLPQLNEKLKNIDLIYEATGCAKIACDALAILGKDGALILTGVPNINETFSLEAGLLLRNMVLNNQIVFGSVNNSLSHAELAIENLQYFYKKWEDALLSVITERYSFHSADLEDVLLGKKKGIKNVIRFY